MTRAELILVVPCYNEAARLDADAFLRFAREHPSIHFMFVDDGSDDDTGAIVERMEAGAPESIRRIHLPARGGKGEAVRAGMRAAFDRRPLAAGFLDADLSTPLAAVADFLAVLGTRPAVEFVLGSRVLLMGRDIRRRAARHYAGRVFATAVSHALDLPVYDTQCGAKVIRVNEATASLFADPFRSRWIFDVELIARYLALPVAPGDPSRRDRLYELALNQWHDKPGSKLRWHDFARSAVELAGIWRARVVAQRRGRGPGPTGPDGPAP